MLPYIYYCLLIVNILLFFSRYKSSTIIRITVVFIIIFVAGKRFDGSYIAYDLVNYGREYTNGIESSAIGFTFLQNMGKALGLSFESFYMILSIAYVSLIMYSIKKLEGDFHLILSVYMIYFILLPMNQMKDQIAFAIFMFIFPSLLKEEKNGSIKYFIGVLIAYLFHPSFIFYELFLLTKSKNNKWILKCISFLFVSCCGLAIIANKQYLVGQILYSFIEQFSIEGRYEKYIETMSHYAPLLFIVVYLLLLGLTYYWFGAIKKKESILPYSQYLYADYSIQNQILMISISLSVFIPPLLLSMTFYRFIRDALFIIIVIISSNPKGIIFERKEKIIIGMYVICISLLLFIYDIPLKGYWQDYLSSFFNNAIFY